MEFEEKYEKLVKKVIEAETIALNSPEGQKAMQKLLEEAKKQNPNLTQEEWTLIKKDFLIHLFKKSLEDNDKLEKIFNESFLDKK